MQPIRAVQRPTTQQSSTVAVAPGAAIPQTNVSDHVLQDGDKTYIIFSLATPACNSGSDRQTFCSEMLHWDEVRPQDGAPTMASLFDPPRLESVSPFAVDTIWCVPRSVALVGGLQGSDAQTFCAEMLHWDEYREQRGALGGSEARMSTLFRPYCGQKVVWYDHHKAEVVWCWAKSVAARESSATHHSYCSEMEHFDDYNAQKGLGGGAPTMRSFFGLPAR